MRHLEPLRVVQFCFSCSAHEHTDKQSQKVLHKQTTAEYARRVSSHQGSIDTASLALHTKTQISRHFKSGSDAQADHRSPRALCSWPLVVNCAFIALCDLTQRHRHWSMGKRGTPLLCFLAYEYIHIRMCACMHSSICKILK